MQKQSLPRLVFMEQLYPGVLTKSNTEKGGWLTDSVPMSTRRQPSNPRLRLGLLGCHLVDIGMKLHSVHFAVKFSSASAAPRLRRTWLQSAPCAISSQVGLSPTWDWVGKASSLLSSTFHKVKKNPSAITLIWPLFLDLDPGWDLEPILSTRVFFQRSYNIYLRFFFNLLIF